ncbi:MAG: 50S ribosomal protein L24 [Gemmatimonadota bacterium]
MHVTKGDTVQVISGESKGTRAKVLRVYPKTGRVVLEGVNIVKRHKRATAPGAESAIVEFPAPIHHSKVMLIDPKSNEPSRVRRRKDKDGTVERIAVKSGQSIPRTR